MRAVLAHSPATAAFKAFLLSCIKESSSEPGASSCIGGQACIQHPQQHSLWEKKKFKKILYLLLFAKVWVHAKKNHLQPLNLAQAIAPSSGIAGL
jgi:hypothetical protein